MFKARVSMWEKSQGPIPGPFLEFTFSCLHNCFLQVLCFYQPLEICAKDWRLQVEDEQLCYSLALSISQSKVSASCGQILFQKPSTNYFNIIERDLLKWFSIDRLLLLRNSR